MNVHRLADQKTRRVKSRAAGRDVRVGGRTEPLGLELVDVMLDLDPGMLQWPRAQGRDSGSVRL